jgi:hypothetical protein
MQDGIFKVAGDSTDRFIVNFLQFFDEGLSDESKFINDY